MIEPFRRELPQHPQKAGSLPIIFFGILRRILWLVRFFTSGGGPNKPMPGL
ncbi:unnamed protein product [marine sediment metagenome]|uniref:Uncharacterized protein n=1 Tax=marine sediment metagenome TaxID=412755 RepID=X1G2I6_9ZZZZ